MLADYEHRVLRYIAGYDEPSVEWGAAMGQAIGVLRGEGLVTGTGEIIATEAGLKEAKKKPRTTVRKRPRQPRKAQIDNW